MGFHPNGRNVVAVLVENKQHRCAAPFCAAAAQHIWAAWPSKRRFGRKRKNRDFKQDIFGLNGTE